MASLQLPDYSVGTIQIGAQSGGVWPVTGTGTAWTSTDGTPYWPIAPFELLLCSGGVGVIGTVTDATHLSLAYWSGSTVAAGASYQIIRMVPSPSLSQRGLIQSLLTMFGNGGVQFVPDGSGNMLLQTLNGSATWVTALSINITTGAVAFPSTTDAVGFRNRLRNPSFSINQRAVSGTVTLAAGAFGHDGVKAGAGGATYTFAASGIDTIITLTSGTLIMPVEASMVEGGTYTFSHAGTAQARVWQGTGTTGSGSYAASPVSVPALTANTQTNVEFSAGTILRPQFEPGSSATAFERRPPSIEMEICQRYTKRVSSVNWIYYPLGLYQDSNQLSFIATFSGPPMRSGPTLTFIGTANTDYAVLSGGAALSGFVINATYISGIGALIYATKTAHGITPSFNYSFGISPNGAILLAAEI